MPRILALGDVVGTAAIAYLQKNLWTVRRELGVSCCLANGENASEIHGLSCADAQSLLDTGVDLIPMGNHTYGRRDLYAFLDNDPRIIRPANFPAAAPGRGYAIIPADGWRMLCINVQGQVFMDALASPFETVEKILAREAGHYDFALLDIHAEATSEKMALARCFDGRIAMMYGTHTHVATADEQILPGGSAYMTDIGMTGPTGGILGTATEPVLNRFRTALPQKFTVAGGSVRAQGVLFDIDASARRVKEIRRVSF